MTLKRNISQGKKVRFAKPPAKATDTPATSRHETKNEPRVYFAFGSNLSLQQMAERCPWSTFLGRGRLQGYRWQINERGYANVVPSPGNVVEGLCYNLDELDEPRLDKNEGVPIAYEKHMLEIDLYLPDNGSRKQHGNGNGEKKRRVKALVYLSPRYTLDSNPREEYVERLRRGATDALARGVSSQYINDTIFPVLKGKSSRKSRNSPCNSPRNDQTKTGTSASSKARAKAEPTKNQQSGRECRPKRRTSSSSINRTRKLSSKFCEPHLLCNPHQVLMSEMIDSAKAQIRDMKRMHHDAMSRLCYCSICHSKITLP
ncbi:predicted protein [Uncinocarpus reesii 1704]|uniref:gamma-glutamylcyclotransferase n=1 Tax=Uncinocarpus reesii (strain UAMH 1704) TaxID=336963 RepID=C4JEP8_UNCRE|nr:uncharacterized protein UREG_02208 [Uncinocarpus reesii 1704]EEP77359.1 predicted protein [Uncinocarpus reesii 1704]